MLTTYYQTESFPKRKIMLEYRLLVPTNKVVGYFKLRIEN